MVGLLIVQAAGMALLTAGFVARAGASAAVVIVLAGASIAAYGLIKGANARRERGGAEPSREQMQSAYEAMRHGLMMYPLGFLILALAIVYIDGSVLSSMLILGGWVLMAAGGVPAALRGMRDCREKLEAAA